MKNKPRDILLIGNGPSVIGYEVGGVIDRFDGDIVRFNQAAVKGYESKVGSRTDIWAFCGNVPHDFRAVELGAGVALMSYPDSFQEKKDLWSLYVNNHGEDYTLLKVPVDEYDKLYEDFDHIPSSGALVANYYLNRGHRVYIYGFDHFSSCQHHYWTGISVHGKRVTPPHDKLKELKWFSDKVQLSEICEFKPEEDSTYMGDKFEEVCNYMGVKLPVDKSILSPTIISAIKGHRYEVEEARHLPYIIQKGERVLELGTGVGLISSLCALNPLVSSVLTVEANPILIDYISRVHQLNDLRGKIEVLNAVAIPAPSSPKVKFYRRDDMWASSLNGEVWNHQEVLEVNTIDLNDIIYIYKPTLLIVDIEGAEFDLFDNVELGTVKKVMLEIHQGIIGRHGVKAVFDALSIRGFHYDVWHSIKNVVTFSRVDRL